MFGFEQTLMCSSSFPLPIFSSFFAYIYMYIYLMCLPVLSMPVIMDHVLFFFLAAKSLILLMLLRNLCFSKFIG